MRELTNGELDLVSGGTGYCSYDCGGGGGEEKEKGNNGWGNGPDDTNNGSFSGATAPTKSTNGINSDFAEEHGFTGR
jgi:hypothetical protein